MAQINFAKNFSPLNVQLGENLMKALTSRRVPVASSCGGEGICGKCVVNVLAGHGNLSHPNDVELAQQSKLGLGTNTRLACQCHIFGDLTIDTGYW